MTMRNVTYREQFEFNNAAELREFLNQFKTTDLETVGFNQHHDYLRIVYETETLSDGSEVHNMEVLK